LDHVNLVRLFQRFVTVEDNVLLDRAITKKEIWDTLNLFSKDKSPGPSGSIVEFFTLFFDVVGDDLLDLVNP
jgi:hypothetical protein